jgi:hypothetical protein
LITDKEFQNLIDRIKKLEDHVFVKKEFSPDKIPFPTFAKSKAPKTHEERAITIGYYIWKFENRNFTYDDVISYCKKIGWPTYTNSTVLIKQLKNKAWIEEWQKNSNGKIEFRVIIDGISQVENNFKDTRK